jgi:sugar lactone lactonase YvrE
MNTNIALYRSIAVTVLGLGAFLTGCGDDTTGAGGSGSTASSSTGSKGSGSSSSSSSTSGSSSSTGGATEPSLKKINKTDFNPAMGQLPEGLAITSDGATAYVGYALSGEIVKITLPEGVVSQFGKVPTPPPPAAGVPQGLVLGLTVGPNGDVYVGVGSFVAPGTYQGGIYKVPAAGGDAGAVFSKDAGMVFPNGLDFDAKGDLYVTDSAAGSIFKITIADGKAVEWLKNDLLKGDVTNTCAVAASPFAVGANGLVVVGTDVIVSNTNKASLVKIPINTDGSAGAPTVFYTPDGSCALKGADGITADTAGNIFVAANDQNALYKVSADGKTATKLIEKGLMDFPASIAFRSVGGVNELLFTNAALTSAIAGTPKPSLASYGPLK